MEAVQASRISHLTMVIRHKALRFVGGRKMKYCVQITNGYILLYATMHLAHIGSVNVMGCVSNSQKMLFQQAISERRAGQPASVTEWDLVGKSAFLVSTDLTWTELRLPDIRSLWNIVDSALKASGGVESYMDILSEVEWLDPSL
ncbi:hypothetical protein SLS56_008482 [Neofusicoccum ribis]|uniref:Uncharacterized protein n=1 Tax=Neofusicoccum ribis TaxID=45134 RepID=A0ABR3SLH4_9PEZI